MMRKVLALLLVVSLVMSFAVIPVFAESFTSSAANAVLSEDFGADQIAEEPATTPESSPEPSPESSPVPSPETSPELSPVPSPETSPVPSPLPSPETSPVPSPLPSPETSPEPSPETSPEPSPETSPEPSPEPSPAPEPVALKTDHAPYISGNGDGTFTPDSPLTWAEISTIIFRLLEDQSMGTLPYTFSDVSPGQWYYNSVSVLASRGIIPCDGGKFYPDSAILRGDFLQLLSALIPPDADAVCDFPDVSETDPRYAAIASAFSRGWISGFQDGTFRPDATLTRAEAVTILNKVLGRSMDPDVKANDPNVSPFTDVRSGAWYYANVLEASVPHTPADNEGGPETWADYQNTYAVTFRYSGKVTVYMIPAGNTISKLPTTSVSFWLNPSGVQISPLGMVVDEPMTFIAFVPPALVTDHVQYVSGYTDGTFRPEDSVSRAEAATLLYRLLKSKSYGSFPYQYDDVSSGAWYYKAISTLTSLGFFTSGDDFRPDDPITRGEFAVMIAHLGSASSGSISFTDVPADSPYYDAILICAENGWISGDGDGTFRPNSPLTRAEAVSVFNRVMKRVGDPTTEKQMDSRYIFTDLPTSHWAYTQIMEASVTHQYTLSGSKEVWSLYYHENVAWPDWESSTSVMNAAKITTSITGVYAGDYTQMHNIDFSTAAKEQFVNSRGYSSSTGYLIWVCRQTQKVYIFTGSRGNWKLYRNCICATGAASTPTPTGVTYTTYKSKGWYTNDYICRPVVGFYPNTGYAFHSRLYYPNDETRLLKPNLGYPMSHGCIRMLDPDINYIYYSIPLRTTVVIY